MSFLLTLTKISGQTKADLSFVCVTSFCMSFGQDIPKSSADHSVDYKSQGSQLPPVTDPSHFEAARQLQERIRPILEGEVELVMPRNISTKCETEPVDGRSNDNSSR